MNKMVSLALSGWIGIAGCVGSIGLASAEENNPRVVGKAEWTIPCYEKESFGRFLQDGDFQILSVFTPTATLKGAEAGIFVNPKLGQLIVAIVADDRVCVENLGDNAVVLPVK